MKTALVIILWTHHSMQKNYYEKHGHSATNYLMALNS
jgi:hypothetical protein